MNWVGCAEWGIVEVDGTKVHIYENETRKHTIYIGKKVKERIGEEIH